MTPVPTATGRPARRFPRILARAGRRGPVCGLPIAVLLAVALAGGAGPAGAATWSVPGGVPTIAAGLAAAVAGDTVLVDCGTYLEHDLVLRSGVVLRSSSGDPSCVTIDAGGLGRALDGIGLGPATRIEGLTITGGDATSGPNWTNAGGGIRLDACAAEVRDCVLVGNVAKFGGGAAVRDGNARFVDCVFDGNDALAPDWAAGGGLYARDTDGEVDGCTFTGNSAHADSTPADGGGLFADHTGLVVSRSTFEGNTADAGAGGLYSYDADRAHVVDCVFSANVAGAGAAVYVEASTPRLERCDLLGNIAAAGGALFLQSGAAPTLVACRLAGNEAVPGSGGAAQLWTSALVLDGCVLEDNHASQRGGAIAAYYGAVVTITDGIVARNDAGADGGAVFATWNAEVTATGSTIVANAAAGAGGGVRAQSTAQVSLEATVLAHSTAGEAASCIESATVTVTNGCVWGNAGGDWTGCLAGQETTPGNVAADPLLCDPANGAYGLRLPDSPLLEENRGGLGPIGALGAACGCPAGATLRVPDDQPTIAAALAAAQPGDVVGVCDGTWAEAITLRDGVHLVGAGVALTRIVSPGGGPTGALVRADAIADSTVLAGLTLDAVLDRAFVVDADSATTGLHVTGNRITGGLVGGVRVGPDSRIVLGGALDRANDLVANGSPVALHLRNENATADSLEARLNWWGTTAYWDEIVDAIEGPVRSCPITDSTHTKTLCAPPSAVSAPPGAPPPTALALAAGPNPFPDRVRIVLSLPSAAAVRLAVHDVAGRRVAVPLAADLPAGRHVVDWDGRDGAGRSAAPGVYFLRLEAGGATITRKLVRLR